MQQQASSNGDGNIAPRAPPVRPSSAAAKKDSEGKRGTSVSEKKGPSTAADCYIPALKPKKKPVRSGSISKGTFSKAKPLAPSNKPLQDIFEHPALEADNTQEGAGPDTPVTGNPPASDRGVGSAPVTQDVTTDSMSNCAETQLDIGTSSKPMTPAIDAALATQTQPTIMPASALTPSTFNEPGVGEGTESAPAAAGPTVVVGSGKAGGKQDAESATELDGSSIVIGRRLGSGTFSTVYLARGVVQGVRQQVVVKRLDRMGKRESEEVKNEIHVMTHAGSHPNLVDFKGWYRDADGMLCLVMGYCGGGTLAELLQVKDHESTTDEAQFPEEQVLQWTVQALLAINHLHMKHILHRDIKPQNIMLSRNHKVLILGDLGASKQLEGTLQLAITCLGTPLYMSPEVIAGKPYTYAADIWSLGCVLYEIATRRTPFEALGLPQLMFKILRNDYAPLPPHFSYPFRTLVSQCLNQDPEDRPTIAELLSQPFIRKQLDLLLGADSSTSVLIRGSTASALQQQPAAATAKARSAPQHGKGGKSSKHRGAAYVTTGSAPRNVGVARGGVTGTKPAKNARDVVRPGHRTTPAASHRSAAAAAAKAPASTAAARLKSPAGIPPKTPGSASAAAAAPAAVAATAAAGAHRAGAVAGAAAPGRTPPAPHGHQQQVTWKELRGSSPVVLVPRMAKGVEKYESTAVAHDQKLKQQAEARFLARQYEMRQMRQQVRQARKDKDPAAKEREAQLELLQEEMLEKQKRRRTVVAQRSLLHGLLGDGLSLPDDAGGTVDAFQQREKLQRSSEADGAGEAVGAEDDDEEILRQWDEEDRVASEALQRIASVHLAGSMDIDINFSTPLTLSDSALFGDGGVELPLPIPALPTIASPHYKGSHPSICVDSGDGDHVDSFTGSGLQPILESPVTGRCHGSETGAGWVAASGEKVWGWSEEGEGEDGHVLQETTTFLRPPELQTSSALQAGLTIADAAGDAKISDSRADIAGRRRRSEASSVSMSAASPALRGSSSSARKSIAAFPIREAAVAVAVATAVKARRAAAAQVQQITPVRKSKTAARSGNTFRQSEPWSTSPPSPKTMPDPLFTLPRSTPWLAPSDDSPSSDSSSLSGLSSPSHNGSPSTAESPSQHGFHPRVLDGPGDEFARLSAGTVERAEDSGSVSDEVADVSYSSEDYEEDLASDDDAQELGDSSLHFEGMVFAPGPPSPSRYTTRAAASPSPTPVHRFQQASPEPISSASNSHSRSFQPALQPQASSYSSIDAINPTSQQPHQTVAKLATVQSSRDITPPVHVTKQLTDPPPQVLASLSADPPSIHTTSHTVSHTQDATAVADVTAAASVSRRDTDTTAVLELEGRLHSAWLDSDEATRKTFLNHIWQLTLRTGTTEDGSPQAATGLGNPGSNSGPNPSQTLTLHPDAARLDTPPWLPLPAHTVPSQVVVAVAAEKCIEELKAEGTQPPPCRPHPAVLAAPLLIDNPHKSANHVTSATPQPICMPDSLVVTICASTTARLDIESAAFSIANDPGDVNPLPSNPHAQTSPTVTENNAPQAQLRSNIRSVGHSSSSKDLRARIVNNLSSLPPQRQQVASSAPVIRRKSEASSSRSSSSAVGSLMEWNGLKLGSTGSGDSSQPTLPGKLARTVSSAASFPARPERAQTPRDVHPVHHRNSFGKHVVTVSLNSSPIPSSRPRFARTSLPAQPAGSIPFTRTSLPSQPASTNLNTSINHNHQQRVPCTPTSPNRGQPQGRHSRSASENGLTPHLPPSTSGIWPVVSQAIADMAVAGTGVREVQKAPSRLPSPSSPRTSAHPSGSIHHLTPLAAAVLPEHATTSAAAAALASAPPVAASGSAVLNLPPLRFVPRSPQARPQHSLDQSMRTMFLHPDAGLPIPSASGSPALGNLSPRPAALLARNSNGHSVSRAPIVRHSTDITNSSGEGCLTDRNMPLGGKKRAITEGGTRQRNAITSSFDSTEPEGGLHGPGVFDLHGSGASSHREKFAPSNGSNDNHGNFRTQAVSAPRDPAHTFLGFGLSSDDLDDVSSGREEGSRLSGHPPLFPRVPSYTNNISPMESPRSESSGMGLVSTSFLPPLSPPKHVPNTQHPSFPSAQPQQPQQQQQQDQELSYVSDFNDGCPAVSARATAAVRRASTVSAHSHEQSPSRRQPPLAQTQDLPSLQVAGVAITSGAGPAVGDVEHAVLGSLMADIKRWKTRRT